MKFWNKVYNDLSRFMVKKIEKIFILQHNLHIKRTNFALSKRVNNIINWNFGIVCIMGGCHLWSKKFEKNCMWLSNLHIKRTNFALTKRVRNIINWNFGIRCRMTSRDWWWKIILNILHKTHFRTKLHILLWPL